MLCSYINQAIAASFEINMAVCDQLISKFALGALLVLLFAADNM